MERSFPFVHFKYNIHNFWDKLIKKKVVSCNKIIITETFMQVKIKTILQLCVKINLKRSLKYPGDYYKN